MEIRTNNHWREFVYGFELTEREKREFDYMEDIDSELFIRYKRRVIALDEFMRITGPIAPHPQRESWENWHGYMSDSFFSGTLIRLSDDCEQYQIAEYFA